MDRSGKALAAVPDLLEVRKADGQLDSILVRGTTISGSPCATYYALREAKPGCLLGELDSDKAAEPFKRAQRVRGGGGCACDREEQWDVAQEAFARCLALGEDEESRNDQDEGDGPEITLPSQKALKTCYDNKILAFRALQQGLQSSYDKWQMWMNYTFVAIDVGEVLGALSRLGRVNEERAAKLGTDSADADVHYQPVPIEDSILSYASLKVTDSNPPGGPVRRLRLSRPSNLRDSHRNLRATNKAFCAAATPRAFRTVGATNRRDSALGLASLLQSNLASYVQEVVYRDYAADEHGHLVDAANPAPLDVSYEPTVEEPLVEAFTTAARLPVLTSIRFVFHPVDRTGASLDLQRALLGTVGDAAPHLRSLTLTNLTPVSHSLYTTPAFLRALSSLTDLRISTASAANTLRGSGLWVAMSHFWYYAVDQYVLENVVNVSSLVLVNDVPTATSQLWTFVQRGTLPRLKYLVVRKLGIDFHDADVDDFVRRHDLLEWIDIGEGPEGLRRPPPQHSIMGNGAGYSPEQSGIHTLARLYPRHLHRKASGRRRTRPASETKFKGIAGEEGPYLPAQANLVVVARGKSQARGAQGGAAEEAWADTSLNVPGTLALCDNMLLDQIKFTSYESSRAGLSSWTPTGARQCFGQWWLRVYQQILDDQSRRPPARYRLTMISWDGRRATAPQCELTGTLGKRTKFYQLDLIQLVLLAGSLKRPERAEALPMEPRDAEMLALNDDSLLEQTELLYSTPAAPNSLRILGHLDLLAQPALHLLNHAILLSPCLNVRKTSPNKQMRPYIARVMSYSGNWLVHTVAPLRARLESGVRPHAHLKWSMPQLHALIEQITTTDSTLSECLLFVHCIPLPSKRWNRGDKELAMVRDLLEGRKADAARHGDTGSRHVAGRPCIAREQAAEHVKRVFQGSGY
ncbi:hypothetical protein FA95DRAFT_1577766 [Auriscalpium vulgare]|uniref:Uncharacterized protein n=1 Tax=Auriscalpium vulgare TaxID=40419 RepID=A0ACB8R5X6_9AGAM|nr:hypothetical protein FA95DRAFT_1577766 [Auriscalpium vulgare]